MASSDSGFLEQQVLLFSVILGSVSSAGHLILGTTYIEAFLTDHCTAWGRVLEEHPQGWIQQVVWALVSPEIPAEPGLPLLAQQEADGPSPRLPTSQMRIILARWGLSVLAAGVNHLGESSESHLLTGSMPREALNRSEVRPGFGVPFKALK